MKKILLFGAFLFCVIFNLTAQDKEFWFVAPDASEEHYGCDFPTFLVISNPSENPAIVEVNISGGTTPAAGSPYTIPAGGAEKITWLQSDTRNLIENPKGSAGTVTQKGIHVKVIHGDGVMAYYQLDASCSKDLFSFKGEYALGDEFYIPMQNDNYYYSTTWAPVNDGGYDQIDIVAAKPTTVTFTIDKPCKGYPNAGGGTYSVFLNTGETFKLIEDVPQGYLSTTLAGTHITADVPNSIAITMTEDNASSYYSTDMIGDQIVPVNYTGTRYVVVKGLTKGYDSSQPWYPPAVDRLYFTASKGPASVRVRGDGGFDQTISLSAAGVTGVVNIDSVGVIPNVVYIEADAPVYCYHVSGVGHELGSAIIPSMFSITQQQLAFYSSDMPVSDVLLVFRDTCENYFEISNDGVNYVPLTVTDNPIPSLPGTVVWKWDKVSLPPGYRNDNIVTIRNTESAFSLGYFNGDPNTASYGYISGFGDWSLPYDTLWRCAGSSSPFTLIGGYALGYKWTFPDGSQSTDIAIIARDTGRYIIDMDVDYKHILDTAYIYEIELDPKITRFPTKPPKVGVPQLFDAASNSNVSNIKYYWTFEGGNPATSTLKEPLITWHSTGNKKVSLTVTVEAGSGIYKTICEKTVTLDLFVRPKNNGYFVDQNVGGGLYDGSDWKNAFTTVQEALDLASQGDYIWVAEGNYSPYSDATYLFDYDSVQIYGGFGGWETKLSERNINAHPTILNGNNNTVVTFDGSTRYLNYPPNHPCGLSTANVLDGFTIRNGKAKNGAGILFTNGGTATITNCVIHQNTATEKGGGLYLVAPGCSQADPILTTVEVSGNTAQQGAGIYNDGSAFIATHITVGGNLASKAGGGLYNADGNPEIRNSIIWDNRDASTNETSMDITMAAGNPSYTYSDIGGSNNSGTNWNTSIGIDRQKNIDIKPMYRQKGFDDNGNMQQGNYRLFPSSKAVNKGRNFFVYKENRFLQDITLLVPTDTVMTELIMADLDGLERISYDIVDMGAYEYYNDDFPPHIQREVLIPEHPYLTTDPIKGKYSMISHEDFILTLFPKEGYSLDYLDIKTGSIFQDELGYKEIIHNPDGSVTVTFHQVTEPLDVVINGVSPVSNEAIDSSYALWTSSNQLHIQTTKAGILKIYNLTGTIINQQELTTGDTTVSLSQGIYIVTFNDGLQQKVVVK